MSSSAEEKISAIIQLKDKGVRTYVFFRPVLSYISDQNIEEYFQHIVHAGVYYVLIDKLNLEPELWPILDNFVLKNLP